MRCALLALVGLTLGCGRQDYYEAAPPAAAPAGLDTSLALAVQDTAVQRAGSAGPVPTAQQLQRKIVYTAAIELVVENFSDLPARVEELVRKNDGYIANSNLGGAAGDRRVGTWKIRVPTERFNAFVDAARGLGEVRRIQTNSQDMSEEYYDVEARVRNRKREEEQLLKLLAERTGKLDDVLAVERELSRVREEVERLEGRLRVLQDLTALTTITLSIDEVKNYMPPEAATLGTRIRRTFVASLEILQNAGEALLIFGVALVPWLPLLLVPTALTVRAWRRKRTTA